MIIVQELVYSFTEVFSKGNAFLKQIREEKLVKLYFEV